jgi:phosphotransferase system enzyme I (PtsP)
MALLGIGFRSISMSPAAIGPVKSMLLSLDLGKLEESCCQHCRYGKWKTVREFLTDFADANGVSL